MLSNRMGQLNTPKFGPPLCFLVKTLTLYQRRQFTDKNGFRSGDYG